MSFFCVCNVVLRTRLGFRIGARLLDNVIA